MWEIIVLFLESLPSFPRVCSLRTTRSAVKYVFNFICGSRAFAELSFLLRGFINFEKYHNGTREEELAETKARGRFYF